MPKISIQYVLMSVLFVGLLASSVLFFITSVAKNTEQVGKFDNEAVESFQQNTGITQTIDEMKGNTTNIKVESNPFDIIGSLINKGLAPLRAGRDSYKFLIQIEGQLIQNLGMDAQYTNAIANFINYCIVVLVVIGFFLIRMIGGKDD